MRQPNARDAHMVIIFIQIKLVWKIILISCIKKHAKYVSFMEYVKYVNQAFIYLTNWVVHRVVVLMVVLGNAQCQIVINAKLEMSVNSVGKAII